MQSRVEYWKWHEDPGSEKPRSDNVGTSRSIEATRQCKPHENYEHREVHEPAVLKVRALQKPAEP